MGGSQSLLPTLQNHSRDFASPNIGVPVHTAYLGPICHLDCATGLTTLQLEAEQCHLGVVEQHHDDTGHSAKGSAHPSHVRHLGNLEGEKL